LWLVQEPEIILITGLTIHASSLHDWANITGTILSWLVQHFKHHIFLIGPIIQAYFGHKTDFAWSFYDWPPQSKHIFIRSKKVLLWLIIIHDCSNSPCASFHDS
jgi:hypothetical protein